MSSNLKVNSLVPATGTEIGIGTTGGSIDFRCPATFGGNVTIGGTLTYDEVINIDSIGVITARSNIDCNGSLDVDGHTELDNVNIAGVTTAAGNIVQTSGHTQLRSFSNPTSGAGMELGYDGTRAIIQPYDRDNSANKNLYIGGGNVGINQVNPTARLEVTGGIKLSGTLDANGDLDVDGHTNLDNVSISGVTTTNTLVIGDTSDTNTNTSDNRIRIGNNQDLQIFHGPNNSYIRNTTNSFNIEQYANATLDIFSNHDVRLRVNGGELAVDCSHNQGVDLYYDASTYSSPKLGTKSWGVYVNGQIGIGTATVRNNRAMQLTGESGSLFLITGHAPSICLNRDADDSSDADRSFFGVSSVSNGFANGTAAGDTIIRGNSTGQIIFATGTSIRSRITSNGCFVSGNIGIGVDDRWKIRSNTSNNELAFEYATSSTLADSNIKMALFANGNIAMGPSNFTPGRHLHIKNSGQIKLESTDTGSWSGLEFLGSSGTNNYDAYMGIQDSDGLFFIDNNSNGIDFAIKYSTGNIGMGGETNPVALLTLNKGSVGSNNSYSTGEILRLEGYDSTNSKHGIGFGRYGGGANGYKPAAFIGAKEGIWSNYTNCHLVFATRISTNDDEPTERFRIRNDGDITIKSNDKGWVTIEHGYNGRGMKRHTREFNTGSSAATYNLIRVRRHYWGWGHYKFTVKRVYYSGIMDSVFYLNGHGRDDGSFNTSYAITEYQHNSHGSNVQSSGRITITSPSASSPGDVYANYVDVQLQCPAYMYLIVEVEAAASNQDADISNLGSDQYALFT